MMTIYWLLSLLVVLANCQNKQSVDDIALENLKIGVLNKDDTPTGNNLKTVAPFSKLASILEVDHTKRIYASATLKVKSSGKPFKAHQVFAIFTHEAGNEVIYVFDDQGSGNYMLDIALSKLYKDFDGISGKYSVRFISGDVAMKNPIDFVMADINISIPSAPASPVPKSEQVNYEPEKEITHIFRQPDKRPPSVVSLFFTAVCLAPLGLLVILWLSVGINFGNMPVSIWVPVFHVSLTGLFGLYFVFWLNLNMFETLKYLAIIGGVAFLSGNRVLRSLSNQRKQNRSYQRH